MRSQTGWSARRAGPAALLIGLVCGWLGWRLSGGGAHDFAVYFGGAQALLHGIDPWRNPAFGPGHSYPYSEPLYYPLPTLAFLLPLAWLPLRLALALFAGGSAALLGYAVLRSNPSRLLLFLSPSLLVAVTGGQWTPLALAGLLLPAGSLLCWLKPSYGAMCFAARPRLRGLLLFGALGLLGLLLIPAWPLEWLGALRQNHHPAAVTVAGGPLLLLAALCWRRPEARLLLGLALVPHLVYWYDALLVWSVPRSRPQGLLLLVTSWAAVLAAGLRLTPGTPTFTSGSAPYVLAGCYLPALGILLWQERAPLAARWQRGRTRLAGRLAAAH